MCPTPSPSHNEKITHATVKTPCALTKPNKHIFLKKRKRTHQVKVEAETGVIHRQPKNGKELLAFTRR